MKKKSAIILFTLIFFIGFSVFSDNMRSDGSQESWRVLKKAQQEFDLNNYAMSMKLAQDSISLRKKEIQYADNILQSALNPYQVRKAGDYIEDVLKILDERQEYEAYSIIKRITEQKGIEFFKGSISKLTEYLKKRVNYPEAFFLIARIYKLEGEYSIALYYLEKARKSADLLEVPSQQADILYEMADIAEFLDDTVMQEKALLLIANSDGKFNDSTLKNALLRTSKSEKEDNSSRFFSLYRIDAVNTIRAYFKLSSLYAENKKYQDSYLTNLYGVLISFTHINSILEERDSDYSYKSLESFFSKLSLYPDIMKWCNDIGFWKGFYDIYELGRKNNFARFPNDIMNNLARFCPEGYWQKAAEQKLNEK